MPLTKINHRVSIHFEKDGNGESILFVHPPGMGLVTFNLQLPLSKKYQVIRMDLRGNGKSTSSSEQITLPLLAKDIKELLDYLQIERVVLCGYSNGGSIVQEFALSYPNRVRGIILIGGFPEVNTFLLRSEFQLGIFTVKMRGLPLLAKVLGKAHGTTNEFKKEIENYVLKANPEILYQMYVEGLKYKCTERLSSITVPVLLISGARDYYIHSYQKLIGTYIKHADKVVISKARHQIPTKHADELNFIIDEFMNKLK
ncbi:alpha/beta hydrolase [Bacillus timonensis]|nr:alpha/beta hydrolase [Bacillus timonensis]